MDEGRPSSLLTIGKAFEIVECIADASVNHSVRSLAERCGLSQSHAMKLLGVLATQGIVERCSNGNTYVPSVNAIRLSQKILDNQNVLKIARPIMKTLEEEHEEAVYVVFMKDADVVFMDMVDTEQQVKAAPLVGQKFPFFTNAAGKVIMAFEPRDYLQKYLKRTVRKASAGLDIERFEEELTRIRATGVAIDEGGLGDGITTIAVAIKDYAGKVVGALAMLGPSFRLFAERLDQEIIPSMVCSAQQLSAKFGHVGI